jgi:Zn-dependent protease with chaperone function
MKIASLAMVMAASACYAWADANPKTSLMVCVGGVRSENIQLVGGAEAVTTRIFNKIDVRVDWQSLRNCPRNAIQVELAENTLATKLPGALAYAHPFDGVHIVVFMDRVNSMVAPATAPYLLGHVIAHEVAHILQRVRRHSETGIMKAQWNREDYHRMMWQPLDFTSEDIALIKRGLHDRAAPQGAE